MLGRLKKFLRCKLRLFSQFVLITIFTFRFGYCLQLTLVCSTVITTETLYFIYLFIFLNQIWRHKVAEKSRKQKKFLNECKKFSNL